MRKILSHALLLAVVLPVAVQAAAPSPEALALRDRGFADLENENPDLAAEAFVELIEVLPDDPLGHANLAIALLRQQKYDAAIQSVDTALTKAPGDASILAIKAEILQWQGDLDGALAIMEQAVAKAPQDLEVLYSAYQLATTARGEVAERVAADTIAKLTELRPENVVVLLQRGQRAIAAGDRSTATVAFARLAQLLWQVDPIALRAMGMVNDALRQDDLGSARVPAIRLENVLKISPMFRESLRELKTGIQGIPLQRLVGEPETTAFGKSIAVTWKGQRLDERPTRGRGLATGDFDGDQRADIARLVSGASGDALVISLSSKGHGVTTELPAADVETLLAVDLDNDGHLDLVAHGPGAGRVWLGREGGAFERAPDDLGLTGAGATAVVAVDYDIEGDLDLVTVGGAGDAKANLYRNALNGPLQGVGNRTLPAFTGAASHDVAVSDLDRDGDLDLAVAHGEGLSWLDNLRQGRFVDRSAAAGLGDTSASRALVAADFDNDGLSDLVAAGEGLVAWRNRDTRFEAWSPSGLTAEDADALVAADFDNDGRLDLAAAGGGGLTVLGQNDAGGFESRTVDGGPASASALAAVDLDGDGDLDLLTAGPEGLHRLDNQGGNGNHWLALRLRGLDKGNSKNNLFGVGTLVEVRSGQAYQFREAAGDVLHLGLGSRQAADVLRVVWTNGVPQNRLQLAGNQQIVEEQLLKGSCPFLYAWDGERMAFVTDLLWAAPLGLPVAPGVWASSDPSEIVRVDGLVAQDGVYDLRVTEELWEAAFFDHVRLWVVDHPDAVEVASNLKVIAGQALPEEVMASRGLRPAAQVWDGRGADVTSAVAERDEVYADGYRSSRYQGVAAEPWTFTFDLGEAPGQAVRLHLDGWIFPSDASLNLAVAQRQDLSYVPLRLEMETDAGWEVLVENTGFPAGKTKTMVIDTPELPSGVQKLRFVSTLWLHWDRLAWTTRPVDDEPLMRAQLMPSHAELRFRGFSQMARSAPNGPHTYDYARLRTDEPWIPFPGNYTRYGDVRPLLEKPDDFSVILAPGDELVLRFDAKDLPPVAEGHRRTLFLESHGWDKDADRNTYEGHRLEPLPFRAMSGYPWGEGESYPNTPEHEAYQRDWLTRKVE